VFSFHHLTKLLMNFLEQSQFPSKTSEGNPARAPLLAWGAGAAGTVAVIWDMTGGCWVWVLMTGG
jgi:hypothetical protein